MKQVIDLQSLTGQKLQTGVYEGVFPEFYQLKGCIENNPWHIQQDVFDHVIAVYKNLEQIFERINLDEYWEELTHTVGDVAYELVVLSLADLRGCDLKSTRPTEFSQQEKLLLTWLQSKLPT